MPQVNANITLSVEHQTCLDAALSLSGNKKTTEYTKFCQLVVEMMCDAISGKLRFRSLTEMHIEVVQKIYEQMFPSECPSADRLFNGFNLPPGQAAYIARVLVDKAVPRWRGIGLMELRAVLDTRVLDYKDTSDADAKDSSAMFDAPIRACQELITISNALMRTDGKTFVMPEIVGRNGDYKKVRMTITSLRRVSKHMKDNGLGA